MRPGQAEEVFSNMAGDFMRPVVDVVDQLLSAGVNVSVYNGQLDLIVDTMGAPPPLPSAPAASSARPLTKLTVCRSGAVGEEAEMGGPSWL